MRFLACWKRREANNVRRERAVKDKARKAIVVFVLHVTEWASRRTHKLRGRAKKFERRAALQPVGQRSMHHCASVPKLVGGGATAAEVCGFDQSRADEGRQANLVAYASISCPSGLGEPCPVMKLFSLATALF